MIIFELTISFFPSFSQRNLGCKNWELTRRRQTKYRTHLRLTGIRYKSILTAGSASYPVVSLSVILAQMTNVRKCVQKILSWCSATTVIWEASLSNRVIARKKFSFLFSSQLPLRFLTDRLIRRLYTPWWGVMPSKKVLTVEAESHRRSKIFSS